MFGKHEIKLICAFITGKELVYCFPRVLFVVAVVFFCLGFVFCLFGFLNLVRIFLFVCFCFKFSSKMFQDIETT